MTVLEVLEKASVYLGLREELDYYFNEDNTTTPSSDTQKKFESLVRAINLILEEISVEYMPVYNTEEVSFEDGMFDISNFEKIALRIVSVKNGVKSCNFCAKDGKIYVGTDGNLSVRYSCVPSEVDEDDDVEFDFVKLGAKTLSFGVVVEYMYLNKIFDEIDMWEDRFYKGLKNALRGIGSHRTPKRRWV